MSRITQELRELAEIANFLSKGNGSITVKTTREPDYNMDQIYKEIATAATAKIQALAEIKPEEYRAIVLSGAEALDIVGRQMTSDELSETIKHVLVKELKGAEFSARIEPEIELKDSVEQHTIDTTKEPESKADPRD